MRTRSTLLLVLLAVGLGAYLYYIERPSRDRAEQKQTLLDVDAEAVKEIALTYPGRELRLVKGAEGSWRLVAPLEVEADQTAVKNLLNAIATAELTKTIDDPGSDLAPYGLDEPTVTIRLGLADGTVPELVVGKQTPIGFKAYAQKTGDPKLYLTTGAFHSGVQKEVKDLRDKTIVAFENDQVTRITLERREGRTTALERRDGAWHLTQPAEHPADPGEVQGLLSALQGLRAQDFEDGPGHDLSAHGLADPQLRITLALGESNAVALAVGDETDGTPKQLYVKRDGADTVYRVGTWVLDNLDKDDATLRDKTVLAFAPDEVREVVVTRKQTPALTLERAADGTWSVRGTTGSPNPETVTQFIDDVRQTKPHEIAADGVTDLAPYGLNEPDVHVGLVGQDGRPLGALLAARHTGPAGDEGTAEEKYYFAREGSATVYEGRRHLLTRLEKSPSDFVVADDAPPADPE